MSGLFGLIDGAVRQYTDELIAEGVRVRVIGRLHQAPSDVQRSIRAAEERTSGGSRMTLNICFNYSGRAEIVDAARALVAARADPNAIDESHFAEHLYTSGQPDVDLLIRTGGDQRTSNFLLWQAAYAELVFCAKYWPDFERRLRRGPRRIRPPRPSVRGLADAQDAGAHGGGARADHHRRRAPRRAVALDCSSGSSAFLALVELVGLLDAAGHEPPQVITIVAGMALTAAGLVDNERGERRRHRRRIWSTRSTRRGSSPPPSSRPSSSWRPAAFTRSDPRAGFMTWSMTTFGVAYVGAAAADGRARRPPGACRRLARHPGRRVRDRLRAWPGH